MSKVWPSFKRDIIYERLPKIFSWFYSGKIPFNILMKFSSNILEELPEKHSNETNIKWEKKKLSFKGETTNAALQARVSSVYVAEKIENYYLPQMVKCNSSTECICIYTQRLRKIIISRLCLMMSLKWKVKSWKSFLILFL